MDNCRLFAAAAACACAATTAIAGGTPHYVNEMGWQNNEADFVNLQFPSSFSVTSGASTPTIYGRIYHFGMTEAGGSNPNIVAQFGYGPIGSNPLADDSGWIWVNAGFNVQVGNDDEYMASIVAPANGTYAYTFRFNRSAGLAGSNVGWTLADLNGAGGNGGLVFDADQLGVMTVTPTPGSAALLGIGLVTAGRRRRA